MHTHSEVKAKSRFQTSWEVQTRQEGSPTHPAQHSRIERHGTSFPLASILVLQVPGTKRDSRCAEKRQTSLPSHQYRISATPKSGTKRKIPNLDSDRKSLSIPKE